jgi:hypothetical protein
VVKNDLSDAFAFHGKLTVQSFHSATKKKFLLRVLKSANRPLVTLNCFKFEVSDNAEPNGDIYY